MSGKSVRTRADNRRTRFRIAHQSMKSLMEEKASQERPPPTREEHKCSNCGFKARYKFVRCPECNRVQEEL